MTTETEDFMAYWNEKTALVNAKLKEYLGDEESPQYLKTMLGKEGYVYDDEAINKTILGPAWSLLEAGERGPSAHTRPYSHGGTREGLEQLHRILGHT